MPRDTPEVQLREEFNRWAEEGCGEEMEDHHLPILEPTLAFMNIQLLDRVLDVRCGPGWPGKRLAPRRLHRRRASEPAPREEAPYLSLAGLYEQQGKESAALEMYERAVRVQPRSPTALVSLDVLALKLGDIKKATSALEEAERI